MGFEMPTKSKTKKQLLNMINELEKKPYDKIRILGDSGITLIGAGLGAAGAGTLANAFGATSIFGVTTVARLVGVTALTATPVGWVIGSTLAAGALTWGISRMIRGGGLSEGRKLQLLQKYREEVKNTEAKERSGDIVDSDRTRFILSLRELIDKNLIPPGKAFKLIEQVEQGRITLSQASVLIQGFIN